MDLKIQNFLDLPDGAGYTAQDGRAHVNVERHGDSLSITSSCDSVARKCLFYEQEVFRQHSRADSLEKEVCKLKAMMQKSLTVQTQEQRHGEVVTEKPPNRGGRIAIAILAGVTAGIVITLRIKRRNEKE